MKSNYNKSIKLRCVVCGSDSDFEHNKIGFVSPERGYEAPVCCTTVENVI